ncbi:MAG: Fe-S cluster assembly protein SufD [Caulobacteraceae bacterium]|nr:Fe-S cluster assembly protein SufD [Caulobacteraceae bacterium]
MMAARVNLADATTFPSRRVEEWKYTDLHRILRETPPSSPEATVAPGGPFAALGGEELAFVNGRATGATQIVVEGETTVRLRFVSTTEGTGHEAACRIELKPGARLLLLESYEGQAPRYVSNVVLDITLGDHARLDRIVLTDEPDSAISLARADVRLGRKADLVQTTLTNGARLLRQEIHVAHPGAAFAHIDGLYVLDGKRHADLTSTVTHSGVDGITSQLTKGVVKDEARGVFQGQIVVREGADGTDARMGHHALILSDRGEVDAKPELEIYADDVACAHGNTVGSLDQNALFYMRSRGIPEAQARAMLTEAFLAEVTDRIGREDLRDLCRAWLVERLG